MENNLMEMHSIFEFVRDGLLGSRWEFKMRHIQYGANGTIIQYRNIPEFHERVVPFMIRRRKKDVLTELPDKTYQKLTVALTDNEKQLYRKWRASVVRAVDALSGSSVALHNQNVLTQMLRLKQVVDHPSLVEEDYDENINGKVSKLEALKELVEGTDQKIVIFTQFTGMARILGKLFNAEIIMGPVPPKERMAIIERFTNDKKQVLVSTDAGAYGLTITVASIVVHYDLTWNPAKQSQREDRLHRMGQKNSVTVVNIIAENTIDDYILEVLYRKLQAFELIVEQADDQIARRITTMDIDAMLGISPS